jgi:hypothetical protein
MKTLLLFFCCVIICYLTGCTLCSTKKVTCSAFDDPGFDNWFPYQQGSRAIFKNTVTADTFSYTIEQVNRSGTYEITTGGFSTAAPQNCTSSAYFGTVNYNNSPFGVFRITYFINNERSEKRLELNFNNGAWEAGEIFDSSIVSCTVCQPGQFTEIKKEQILVFENGGTYNDVIVLTSDTATNKFERAYKLFIAKNRGIIGCEKFPSKQKWVLQ